MLANTKYIYALDMWSVEKRPNGWYFSKSAYHGDKHNWRGPYRSEMSVTLMIAGTSKGNQEAARSAFDGVSHEKRPRQHAGFPRRLGPVYVRRRSFAGSTFG